MKTNFLAGFVATLVTIVFVIGFAIFMVTVLDWNSEGRMPYVIAFICIAIWMGIYKWLKPKEPSDDENSTHGSVRKL